MSKQNQPLRSSIEFRFAAVLGMDAETREAYTAIKHLAAAGPVAVPGIFMPDQSVRAELRRVGTIENATEDDFRRARSIAIPFGGVATRDKRRWLDAGWKLTDTGSPHVRRAQVALGLLRLEGARPLVIGRHDDPETRALAADYPGTIVLQDTTDIARLRYEPAFGAVCQTTLSPRLVLWLSQQLKLRYRDARIAFLDTVAPGMAARERALELQCGWCDGVVVAGDPEEATVEALVEAAGRLGKPVGVLTEGGKPKGLEGCRRLVVTAGGFVPPERVEQLREMAGRAP